MVTTVNQQLIFWALLLNHKIISWYVWERRHHTPWPRRHRSPPPCGFMNESVSERGAGRGQSNLNRGVGAAGPAGLHKGRSTEMWQTGAGGSCTLGSCLSGNVAQEYGAQIGSNAKVILFLFFKPFAVFLLVVKIKPLWRQKIFFLQGCSQQPLVALCSFPRDHKCKC